MECHNHRWNASHIHAKLLEKHLPDLCIPRKQRMSELPVSYQQRFESHNLLSFCTNPTAQQAKSGHPEQARAQRIGLEAARDLRRGDQIGHPPW